MLAHIYNAHTGATIARGEVAGAPEPGDEIDIQIDDEHVKGVVVPLPTGVVLPPGISLVIPVSVVSRYPAPHLNRQRWASGAYTPPGAPLPPPPRSAALQPERLADLRAQLARLAPPPPRPNALPPERLQALRAELDRLTPEIRAALKKAAAHE